MADVVINGEYFKVTGSDTNRYIIGSGGDAATAAISLVLVATTPVGVSATIQARSAVPQATQNNATWFTHQYRAFWLNGVAGTPATPAGTALSDNSTLIIPCSGFMIAINLTGHTSGTLEFYIKRMTGAPAI